MKSLFAFILCVCFSLAITFDAVAQDMPQAKKMEGHTWHQVVMVKFKPGMVDSAANIIDNHFMKAGMAMESDMPGPQIMRLHSGEWDMMMVWTMRSIEDMNWETSPEDAKWMAQMAKQEGSMDNAMKLMKSYLSLIDHSTSYLATTQNPQMEGESMGSADSN